MAERMRVTSLMAVNIAARKRVARSPPWPSPAGPPGFPCKTRPGRRYSPGRLPTPEDGMSKNLAGKGARAPGGSRGDGAALTEYHAPQNGQGRQVTGGTNRATAEDYGKLLLRLAVGGLMLFHGFHKVRQGVGWMSPLLEAKGLPALMAYGSYLGEVAAPLLILAGVLTRLSS